MEYIPSQDRYGKMEYRRSGESGLKLPVISLGFWHNFGSENDYENMRRMCQTAFDSGITHFDLANNYGRPKLGSAEENLGKILEQDFASHRRELVISTKAGYYMWEGPYGEWGSRKHLLTSLDESLMRLKLDYVDIFYHHRPDPDTPLEETIGALDYAVKSGKALYAGLSNYDGEMLEEAIALFRQYKCPFIINQNRYSILDRTIERNGLLKTAKSNGKGVIVFSPLEQGMLSDKYLNGIPEDSRIRTSGIFLKESSLTPDKMEKISTLNELAKGRGETLAQMALSWILNNDAVTSVLIGASTPEQIIENAKTVNRKPFTEDELKEIDRISLG